MRHLRTVSLLGGCLLATLGKAASGPSGSILAQAIIPSSRITIAGVTELRFGSILPGVPRTIDPQTSSRAGRFELRGAEGTEFELAMTLPTELHSDTSSAVMPISFGPRAGCHREGVQLPGCQYYDPSTTLTAWFATSGEPDEILSVWLGGTVQPAPDQMRGPYTAFATATVAYTANE